MSKSIADKIKSAQAAVTDARQKRSELEGRRKQLMERLVTEHRLSSVKEANDRVTELEAQAADKQEQLDSAVEALDDLMSDLRGDE